MRFLLAILLAVSFLKPTVFGNTILFSNFEAGGFRTDIGSGLGPTSPRMQVGFQFQPEKSGMVTSYTLALSNIDPVAANRTLDLILYHDIAGRIDASPSGLLDRTTLNYPLNGPRGEYSVESATRPELLVAERYWLVAEVTTGESFIWYATNPTRSELPDFILNFPAGTPPEGIYFPSNFSEDSAFRISGVASVPEPSSLASLISILFFVLVSKRGNRFASA